MAKNDSIRYGHCTRSYPNVWSCNIHLRSLGNIDIKPLAPEEHRPVLSARMLPESLPLPVRIDPVDSQKMLTSTSDSARVCSDRLSLFAMRS